MDKVDAAIAPAGSIPLGLHGQTIHLLRERAAYWPDAETLIVADIHLGKAAAFRKHGLPIPEGDSQGDLERLTFLIERHRIRRLIIAGDLLHAASSKSLEIRAAVEKWRGQHSDLIVVLVSGNHDRSSGAIPDEWQIAVHPAMLSEAPFAFVHDPADIPAEPDLFYFCGHLHPAVSLAEGRMRSLKSACFWQTPHSIVLPGFGNFTGSKAIRPAPTDAIFAITEHSVVQVPLALLSRRS
ncbi:MAG: ligase-associated DNA damage response endonuclease PdeM [Verrucomicrobia bacterium]|nr:ligase-associated DNA damage response endonuclease PdeM [Verrucomicrobiota bacterium]